MPTTPPLNADPYAHGTTTAQTGAVDARSSRRAWWRHGARWVALLGLLGGDSEAIGTSTHNAAPATTLTVGGVGSVMPLLQRLATQFELSHTGLRVRVVQPPMGSTGSLRALAAQRVDVAVAGRPLGATETGQVLPWLRTPIVFASSSGRLDRLDLPMLQAIYTGELRRWPDGSPLRLVLRAPSESEMIALREALPELIPALDAALARRDLPMPDDDLAALEFLARVTGTFGTTSLGLVNTLQTPVRIMGFEGLLPQQDNQVQARYRLWSAYHLVHRPEPPPEVRRFVNFLRAPSSLRMAGSLGYLPIDR